MKGVTLKKSFCNDAFYTECGEWLTNGHWAIKVENFKLPKTFREGLRSPKIDSILPRKSQQPLEWTRMESVSDSQVTRLGVLNGDLVGANPEYLDAITPDNGLWWGTDNMSIMYLTMHYGPGKPDFKADDVIAALMPMRIAPSAGSEIKRLAVLVTDND